MISMHAWNTIPYPFALKPNQHLHNATELQNYISKPLFARTCTYCLMMEKLKTLVSRSSCSSTRSVDWTLSTTNSWQSSSTTGWATSGEEDEETQGLVRKELRSLVTYASKKKLDGQSSTNLISWWEHWMGVILSRLWSTNMVCEIHTYSRCTYCYLNKCLSWIPADEKQKQIRNKCLVWNKCLCTCRYIRPHLHHVVPLLYMLSITDMAQSG